MEAFGLHKLSCISEDPIGERNDQVVPKQQVDQNTNDELSDADYSDCNDYAEVFEEKDLPDLPEPTKIVDNAIKPFEIDIHQSNDLEPYQRQFENTTNQDSIKSTENQESFENNKLDEENFRNAIKSIARNNYDKSWSTKARNVIGAPQRWYHEHKVKHQDSREKPKKITKTRGPLQSLQRIFCPVGISADTSSSAYRGNQAGSSNKHIQWNPRSRSKIRLTSSATTLRKRPKREPEIMDCIREEPPVPELVEVHAEDNNDPKKEEALEVVETLHDLKALDKRMHELKLDDSHSSNV